MVQRQRSAPGDCCMPFYEHVYLARQDLTTAQVDTLSEKMTGIIESQGGKVQKTEYWGLRTLAYKIKKNRKAHYVLFNIEAPTAAVAEFERQFRLEEDIIRFQTVRVDALDPEPSPIIRRDERSGRGPHGGAGRGGPRRDRGPKPVRSAPEQE